MTSLLIFFIVFYGGQQYTRFRMFYSHCVGLGGTTMNWVSLVRNHLPPDPHLQWHTTRLILASMHILYYTLNESKSGMQIDSGEWNAIHERQVLL